MILARGYNKLAAGGAHLEGQIRVLVIGGSVDRSNLPPVGKGILESDAGS